MAVAPDTSRMAEATSTEIEEAPNAGREELERLRCIDDASGRRCASRTKIGTVRS
jgi:hypothetical protein